MLTPLPLLLAVASGQGLDQHHPDIPGATIAAENGPGTLWVNPANLAYDPDPRYGLYLHDQFGVNGATSTALTAGVQGLQVGIHNLLLPDPADPDGIRSDWSLDYGTSIPLPERVSLGLMVSWNFLEDAGNYVGYDAALSWRPLPWLGAAAVAHNVGAPDPSGRARPRTTGGLAFRPFGDAAVLGLDYGRTFAVGPRAGEAGNADEDSGRIGLRLRPTEGLYLRADSALDVDLETGEVGLVRYGLGLEVFFDGVGGGLSAGLDRGVPATYGFIGTDEPGESLFSPPRSVQTLSLASAPAYEPRATFLVLDPGPSWIEVLERLRLVEEDRSVKAVVLDLRGPGLSWARWQEIRDRIDALQAEGKQVVAYLDGSAGNGAYYLATGCDRIVLHPAGEIGLTGMNAELQNLRGLLDLVGVEPQFVRRSEYKGGPETFTHTEPSPANLEAMTALYDDLFGALVTGVSERAGDADKAREWIDEGPWTARDAREAGLVDALLYPDELERELEMLLGGPVHGRNLLTERHAHSPWDDPAKIALVYIDGAIVDGESSAGGLLGSRSAGADTIVRQLLRARDDRLVRAIVVRVDSPGGSALASDRIWQAVEQVQAEGKPVVVSMGGLAASGGYYVAAGADRIWAEPATITGSIGVYGGKFSTAELFNTVGVGVTPITRGRNADLYSSSRPWDDVQRAKVQSMVDETYRRFKKVVSDGRGMTMDEVEEVARGRVWTAERAVDNGLVDELGGLQDAILDARDRAGIQPRRKVGLVSYTQGGSLLDTLAPSLIGRVMGPLDDLLVRDLPPAPARAELEALDRLLPDLGPATLLQAQHPETIVWMMDPWLTETNTR